MVTKELIERFFRNDCSPEDQQKVLEYFIANPNEFEGYLDENEWEFFLTKERMDPALSEKLFENVRRQTTEKRRKLRFIRRLTVAASILLVLGLGWIFLDNTRQPKQIASTTNIKADSASFVVRHEVNTTGKEKRVELPDGSVIILANNSEVTYQEPFIDRRDLTLIGKAYFKVAKDKNRPFRVISGELSTTAVGTEFTVTAFGNTDRIIVRLYEGKVMVKPMNKMNQLMKKPIYLLPGQEFVYGSAMTAKVLSFKVKKTVPEQLLSEEIIRDNLSISETVETPYFMFNNQPLSQVLVDLGALYNVEIVYDKNDVEKIYFTGKYNKSESIETILNRIGILNNLTITKKDSAFILSK
jgi:ferric-dicitrate binding protein FerR (iron transport regulator)